MRRSPRTGRRPRELAWRVPLYLVAAIDVAFGLWSIARPHDTADLLSLGLLDDTAAGEIRTVFGGLVLAIGVLIWQGVRRGRPAWLRVVGYGHCGLAAGRAASLVLDGMHAYTAVSLAFEAGVALLLLYGARRLDFVQKNF